MPGKRGRPRKVRAVQDEGEKVEVVRASKSSRYMSGSKVLKKDHYEHIFISGTATLSELSFEKNGHNDANAPSFATLSQWSQRYRWLHKRKVYNESAGHRPEALLELEGKLEQVKQAYAAASLPSERPPEPEEQAPHYSDNFGDKLKPFYLSSLSDLDQLSLSRDIAVTDMLLADISNQIELGGSSEDWSKAKAEFKALQESIEALQNGNMKAQGAFNVAMKNLSRLFNRTDASSAISTLAYWQDHRRKLIVAEYGRIEKAETYLNVNDAMRLAGDKLSVILQVIKEENNPTLTLKIFRALGVS